MLRNRIVFCLLALGAAALAACSTGGGGAGIVPGTLQASQPSAMQSLLSDARHRRHPVRASVYLRIPAPHHHRRRRMNPQYISPGTASISFAVAPIAASGSQPTPMPLQTMNVATPPCKTVYGSSAAVLCRFTVNVMPGRDSFVVKTYSGSNASGKVLSEYSSGPTVVPTPDPRGTLAPLNFTLEGVIDHVVLQFPAIVVPADTQGQVGAIPVGVATSAPLNVTPYDAANYQILSQVAASGTPVPYAAPITLTVAPAGKGMTLSNDTGSGNSVKISNPGDLYVNVLYSGAFTASGGSVSSTTSFSIGASGSTLALRPRKIDRYARKTATPAPNSAGIALSGNAIPGGTVTTTLTSPEPSGLVSIPGSSGMAFYASGFDSTQAYTAILGTATGGVPSVSASVAGSTFTGMYPDSLGNLWTFDAVNNQIDCFSPASLTTPAGTIPSGTLYPGGTYYYSAGFAQDSSNDLWFAIWGYQGAGYFETIGYVPIDSTSCASPSTVVYQAANANYAYPQGIAAIPNSSSVALGYYDSVAGTSIQVAATPAAAPSGAPTPSVTSVAIAAQPAAVLGGPTSAYAFVNGSLGTVSSGGAFSSITSYPSDLSTFIAATTATGYSSSGVLGTTMYNGYYSPYYFVTLLNPADTNAATNLEALEPASYCNGIAFDAQDTAWTFCLNSQNQLQFYHIVPTSTWSVLPGTAMPITVTGCLSPFVSTAYIGILEAFGSSAGPFNLTNYNTSVISGVTQEGSRGISLTITEPSAGSFTETADVVDRNGRTVPVTFNINATAQACAPRRPRQRAAPHQDPHARRGYPPIPRN